MVLIEELLDNTKDAINNFKQNQDNFREEMATLFKETIQPTLQDAADSGTVRLPSEHKVVSFMNDHPGAYSSNWDRPTEDIPPSNVSRWGDCLQTVDHAETEFNCWRTVWGSYEVADAVVEMAWQAMLSAQGKHIDHWIKERRLTGEWNLKRDDYHTTYLKIKISGKDAVGTEIKGRSGREV
jgi:hypothetical protein